MADARNTLDNCLQLLATIGGFDFLEFIIDGLGNLNPQYEASKKRFLTGAEWKAGRDALKKTLRLWIEVLSDSTSAADADEKANALATLAAETLKKNQKIAVETCRELETNYWAVDLFFKNAWDDRAKNVTFINASLEQISDLDGRKLINYVSDELKKEYDRLDLRDNYSILCIPDYLGSNKVVDQWARIANEYKVMLVTDFMNLDCVDDVIDMFESANLTSGDVHKSNVVMTCNWMLGRAKIEEIGEEEDLFVPSSPALAGKMYTSMISQITVGKKNGMIHGVDSVCFNVNRTDIGKLDRICLVPMVKEFEKVMAFSAKTLFNGDNLALQTYSVVRVFDYLSKCCIDFLNRRAFENWTSKTEKDLLLQIVEFLNKISGPEKFINEFSIQRFERDEYQKDRVYLDINIRPYFPARWFMLKLDGTKGDSGATWKTEIVEESSLRFKLSY